MGIDSNGISDYMLTAEQASEVVLEYDMIPVIPKAE